MKKLYAGPSYSLTFSQISIKIKNKKMQSIRNLCTAIISNSTEFIYFSLSEISDAEDQATQ